MSYEFIRPETAETIKEFLDLIEDEADPAEIKEFLENEIVPILEWLIPERK